VRATHVLAAAIACSALAAGAVLGPDDGDAGAAKGRAAGGDEPRLEIERRGAGTYIARLGYEAQSEIVFEIELDLVAKPLGGRRERIGETTAVTGPAGPGRVRESARLREATASCYAYVRCKLVAAATIATPAGEPLGSANAARGVQTGRPRVRERHIPYGEKRRRQMAAYSKRHYGEREWRLEPRGIVEHYTATSTAGPAVSHFAANRPDPEYGELPGVCAHFLIDRDGTILELVPTRVRCRHTVGLNHETVGIEHVGRSDGDVVGRPRVLRSSLALTSWLRCAYEIKRSNVIGHNESLDSPLYKELVPRFQGRTHADMKPATMRRYRRKLAAC
jgi:N-acetylmuramoyl-L-alanine amidase